jgi:hypothetical protein
MPPLAETPDSRPRCSKPYRSQVSAAPGLGHSPPPSCPVPARGTRPQRRRCPPARGVKRGTSAPTRGCPGGARMQGARQACPKLVALEAASLCRGCPSMLSTPPSAHPRRPKRVEGDGGVRQQAGEVRSRKHGQRTAQGVACVAGKGLVWSVRLGSLNSGTRWVPPPGSRYHIITIPHRQPPKQPPMQHEGRQSARRQHRHPFLACKRREASPHLSSNL